MAKLPLDSDRIWSTTVSGKPKSDMLVKLQGQHPDMVYHFVEDKLGTLEKVRHVLFPALTHQHSVQANLQAWTSLKHDNCLHLTLIENIGPCPRPLPALIRSAGRMQVLNYYIHMVVQECLRPWKICLQTALPQVVWLGKVARLRLVQVCSSLTSQHYGVLRDGCDTKLMSAGDQGLGIGSLEAISGRLGLQHAGGAVTRCCQSTHTGREARPIGLCNGHHMTALHCTVDCCQIAA